MITAPDRPIRVRLAPSPTGLFHIGTARTGLFNWLFARANNGVFILRLEDTDKERSKSEYERSILEGLAWLGMDWDEGLMLSSSGLVVEHGDYGPYRQSERTEIYKKYLEQLLADGHAYYCYCTKEELEAERQGMLAQGLPAKYSGHCKNITKPPEGRTSELIRFKTPEATVTFKDMIRGTVSFNAGLLGDMVIAKNLENPLYNFAVVVDDALMKISHVIRGEDHLSNTPKQIVIQKALGFEEPIYAHMPLILNADRSKLSKRSNETSLLEYRREGFLPEAMINFTAFLGWHPAHDDQEIFSKDELIKEFDIRRVQKSGAVFNPEKLEWFNAQHIKKLSIEDLAKRIIPYLEEKNISFAPEFLERVLVLEHDRMKTLSEFTVNAAFFFELPEYDASLLIWKNSTSEKAAEVLNTINEIIEKQVPSEAMSREGLSSALGGLIEKEGRGVVLWPLRAALSGLSASPDPFSIAEVLGREETMKRILIAYKKLNA